MSNIYDLPLFYRLGKRHVNGTFKAFYGEYIVLGKENIPENGPILYAPNHLNALMDALAILSISSEKHATSFLSRADMFKKKPVAQFLNFAKMMPAFRIRDGIENLGKNAESFDKCVELLELNNALCIMPEGNQELQRKLRPLVKGIFRIAFMTQAKIGSSKSVKIIPVGIELSDFIKFGKKIIINIGKPIDVLDYMEMYNQNQAIAINEIRNQLKISLESLTLNIATDTHYTGFEAATRVLNTAKLKNLGLEDNTVNRFYARREIARQLIEIENTSPDLATKIDEKCIAFESKLKPTKLRISNLEQEKPKISSLILKSLMLIILSPLFIIGFALNIIPFQSPIFIRKLLKVKFEGFFSTLHYGISLLTFPIFYFIQAVILTSVFSLSWWIFILIFPFQLIMGKIAFKWYCKFKEYLADIKLLNLNKDDLNDLKTQQKDIISLIIK